MAYLQALHLTHLSQDKMAILQNVLYFDKNFTEVCS